MGNTLVSTHKSNNKYSLSQIFDIYFMGTSFLKALQIYYPMTSNYADLPYPDNRTNYNPLLTPEIDICFLLLKYHSLSLAKLRSPLNRCRLSSSPIYIKSYLKNPHYSTKNCCSYRSPSRKRLVCYVLHNN